MSKLPVDLRYQALIYIKRQVTKNYIVSEEDKEPPAKRRRPARSSAVSYATNSISEPDSGSEYDPSIKIESKGDKRSLRKGSRLRRSKTIHSKISKNHKFKAEGPLVTIKDGMAVVKLPSDALRALSPVVRDNAFQTPTHQVIPPYPGSEVGNDQVSNLLFIKLLGTDRAFRP